MDFPSSPVAARSHSVGLALQHLEELVIMPRHRAARHGGSMASPGLQALLAMAVEAEARWATEDSARSQGAHSTDVTRQPNVGRSANPG